MMMGDELMLSFVPAVVEGQAMFVITGDHGRDAHATAGVEGQVTFVIPERIIQVSTSIRQYCEVRRVVGVNSL